MPAPDVIVDFVFEDGLFFLAITNIGPEPAERVHVAFDPPFKGLGGSIAIADLPLFRNIEFIAPAHCIRTLLDSAAAYFVREEPEGVTVHISFADRTLCALNKSHLPERRMYKFQGVRKLRLCQSQCPGASSSRFAGPQCELRAAKATVPASS
jgi:hypothetical protein